MSRFDALAVADSNTRAALEAANTWYATHNYDFLGIAALIISLLFILMVGYYFDRYTIKYVPLAGVAIMLGSFMGLIIRGLGDLNPQIRGTLVFSESLFFVVLLPPIIFESAIALKRGYFFRNIGVTSLLAWFGTAFSAFFTGTVLYMAGQKGWCYPISFVEAMLFGSLISATDPVSVLAVFSKLAVHRDLNAIIFGESILNDAVAIVLVRAIEPFLEKTNFQMTDVYMGIVMFVIVFAGSVVLGILIALATALFLKYTHLRSHSSLEVCFIILQGYISYFVGEGIHLSGIVALLFNGIAVAHYGFPNMSAKGITTTRDMLRVCAEMAEIFIFIYLGLATFSFIHEYDIGLIVLTFILINVARALHVALFVALSNGARAKLKLMATIPTTHAIMIWFAGLRGAIAFALALSMHTPNSDALLSTTLVIVLITVLVFGLGTEPLLEKLNIETGVTGDDAKVLAEERKGFLKFDAKVLLPIFTNFKDDDAVSTTLGANDAKKSGSSKEAPAAEDGSSGEEIHAAESD
eukprot:comp19677_c0_seq1/m.37743 comp19677_c0_seq1/g.37743  ORF comp19677_c0_seq1/g.37743 comp19677_c0_seq1/m.37743 type:complete len:524 (-) comp19677_c0_seq1:230-1801(-)